MSVQLPKIGNYKLGTPVEVGVTGDKQFYYPSYNGAPMFNSQLQNFHPNPHDYNANINSFNDDGSDGFNTYLRNTGMFDYNQQFVSPGTAYGYGTKIETQNNPFKTNISSVASDALTYHWNNNSLRNVNNAMNYLFHTSNFLSTGALYGFDENNFEGLYNFMAYFENRYNAAYHSSLFTELIKLNIQHAFNSFGTINDAEPRIRNLTRFLFSGKHTQVTGEETFNVPGDSFKFVEAGLPYVKFIFSSRTRDLSGTPVGTSDNQIGQVEYYMLMNTPAHYGLNQDQLNSISGFENASIYDLVPNNFSSVQTGFGDGEAYSQNWTAHLNETFDISNYSTNLNLANYLAAASQEEITTPTIIADFREPVFSVGVEDASTLGFSIDSDRIAFPLPGQYNPGGEPNKAPNFGFHPLKEDEWTEDKHRDYLEYESTFLSMGAHPYFFTFDNLFMQDYDLLGQFPENATLTEMSQFFYDMDWLEEKEAILWDIYENEIGEYNEGDDDVNPARNATKVAVMISRIEHWRGLLNTPGGTLGNNPSNQYGNWETWYLNSAVIFGNGIMTSNLNLTGNPNMAGNEPYVDYFSQVQQQCTLANNGIFDSNRSIAELNSPAGGSGEDSSLDIYTLANSFSPPAMRMFGPPAPIGYVPKCGVNYRNYFGISSDYVTGELPTLGNTNFVFNGGLTIGGIESLETALGFDTSELLTSFEDYNFSTQDTINLFDRELWKLFYDVQLMMRRHYLFYNEGGTNAANQIMKTHTPRMYQDLYIGPGNEGSIILNALESSLFTPREIQKFSYCLEINNYLNQLDMVNSNQNYTYNTILLALGGGVSAGYEAEPGYNDPFIDFINPYMDNSYSALEGSIKQSTIRDLLVQIPNDRGGISDYEIGLWIDWVRSGCTYSYPTPHYPPEYTQNIDFSFEQYSYGVFDQIPYKTISNSIPNGSKAVSFDVDITFSNWWQICQYLNDFDDLKNGQINFITTADALELGEGAFADSIIFTNNQFIDGTGTLVEKGFYPANPSAAIPNSFFQTGENIAIHFNYPTTIQTEAFGPEQNTINIIGMSGGTAKMFAAGTTFLQAIQELINDGIEGQTIDCYNQNNVTSNFGDGIYEVADGQKFLDITAYGGQPDYRPLQLIQFAQTNNLMSVLYSLLPPSSSPMVPYDNAFQQAPLDDYFKFPLPPLSIGVFDNINSAAKIFIEEAFMGFQSSNIKRGYFTNGPGTAGQKKDVSYNLKEHNLLNGNEITTGSRNASNHPYFFTILADFDNLNEFSSNEIFDVSWGHIRGEGSLSSNNTKGASEAVYRQAANELLGNDSGSFYSVSQSILAPAVQSVNAITQQPAYMSDNPTPDEYVWILRAKQRKLDDSLAFMDTSPLFKLSGSNAAGNGVTQYLATSRAGTTGGFPNYKEQSGLKRYYLSAGNTEDDARNKLQTQGVYGYWFPEIGTAVINSKIAEVFTGGAGTTVTEFNKGGVVHNGMVPSGLTKTDKEYNNSLKLINCLKNETAEPPLQRFQTYNPEFGKELNIVACIRLKTNEFNFTTNTTRFVDLKHSEGFNTFPRQGGDGVETMKFNESLRTSPTTYITHIDLYDRFGNRIATAKLSKPIKKDFNSEVVIKIHIKDY
tara:strand:+ start:939 stop:5771 length:4833 start_codon:yes stop_codon:yes gene_type:complete